MSGPLKIGENFATTLYGRQKPDSTSTHSIKIIKFSLRFSLRFSLTSVPLTSFIF